MVLMERNTIAFAQDEREGRRLFHKALSYPSEAVPAAEEDKAADVLVEGEDGPHGHEAPAQADAEDIAYDDLHSPHHDDADKYREIYIAGASEGVHTEEIEGAAVFKQYFDT